MLTIAILLLSVHLPGARTPVAVHPQPKALSCPALRNLPLRLRMHHGAEREACRKSDRLASRIPR